MSPWRYEKWLPSGVLALGLVLAVVTGLRQQVHNREVAVERFDALTARAAAQVQTRMQLYEYGLRGARGAVIAAGGHSITRQRFREYAASRDSEREFPGARGFGFVRRVPLAQEAQFLQSARADGWPGFSIRQLSPHTRDRYVIQYVEPVQSNMEAVGLDIASERNRREAAERAMRTGRPALTGPITLVQATGQRLRSFLLLLPVYGGVAAPDTVPERVAQTIGWAYTPLVTDEVLGDFDFADGEFALSLHDRPDAGDPERFFTAPGWRAPGHDALVKTVGVSVFGRVWLVEVQALPPFFTRLNLRSPLALAATVAAAFALLAVLVHLYQLGARRARLVGLQRARMAAMVENSPDAIIGQTMDGVVRDWNPAAERMFGYPARAAVGRTVRELIVPDGREGEEVDLLARVARGQTVPGFDTVRRRSDGRLLDVSVSVAPIRLEGGAVVGVAKTLRDISDRKAAEAEILQLNATLEQQVAQRTAELRELAARERAILASAGSAIIAIDNEGVVTLFNPAAEAMLGYRAADVVGVMRAIEFHDPEEVSRRAQAMARELGRPVGPRDVLSGRARDEGVVRDEWTYVRRDGTRLRVLLTLSALHDEAGVSIGYIGVAIDLSDRARLQHELIALNQALLERSAQAEAATRAKSEFLANMSHEIRTPMNAIVGLTEMMRREVRDASLRERLDKMTDASRHLLAIINNVLDLSKIEAGRLVLEQVEFELCDVLDNTFALVVEEARRKGLELVLDASEAPRRLVGDPTRLGQALLNLLSNAVKFTDVGYVALRLRRLQGGEDEAMLRFEVTDSGIGIAPEALDKLFKAFEQGDTSTTRRYGGTGLGLAITHELAELMGGRAGASSRLGHGSTFWFTARLRPVQRQAPEVARWAGVHALVYHDMPVSSRALAATLAQLGATADEAGSADEVAVRLQQARRRGPAYELLVWDADSRVGAAQDRTSLQVLGSLRKGDRDGVAIIVTTMRPAGTLRMATRGLGRCVVLEKPVTAAALDQCLRGLLAEVTAPGELAAEEDDAADDERPFEGRHVLLAEDNPVNQLVAVEQLRSLGLEVDVAENGLEALERARATRYDLILMDLHMPEMDGLEATRAIRRLPAHGSTPILAMTASAFGEDRSASLAAGMDDHISKPVETKVLVRTLQKWLHHPRPPGNAAVQRPAGR